MKHLGDITKISGSEVEPVEVIIGGSPCQDLSVAGKRAGLNGERSGLFMEQIRIIKEMRESDKRAGRTGEFCRPRFMVWENVPGALSSNGGEDFRIVLEETAKVADPKVSISRPEGGRWTNAGCIMGDRYSIAWRILDAQYFGVPQRRRRIALVTDFGGETAPEILFKSESLSGNIEQGRTERETAAPDAERCADTAISFQERAGCPGGARDYSSSTTGQELCQPLTIKECFDISAYESNAMKSSNPHSGIYVADTSRTLDNNGGNPACNQGGMIVLEGNGSRESHKGDGYKLSETMYTLNTIEQHAVCCGIGGDKSNTLDASYYKGPGERGYIEREVVYDARGNGNGDIAPTITGDHQSRTTDYSAICCGQNQGFVRRLTPLECERLQGYPDGWTDIGEWIDSKGKKHKDADSPRYKALGNSIAVCCWRFILAGINEHCRYHTMASLFDGIGGFPLIWEELNGSKSCRWVSEIEEFPIAVTKARFEQEGGNANENQTRTNSPPDTDNH